jgi:Rho termination factor, N-terminal domain
VDRSELETKHLAELHALAAEAGVERYRMLGRAELIEKLAGDGSGKPKPKPDERREPSRRGGRGGRDRGQRERRERQPRQPREEGRREPKPEPAAAAAEPAAAPRPKRKRRRRRWGRRRKAVRVHDLLLPPAPGRRAIVYAESREGCTALLRELAAELAGASKGPDPIALLVDPSPEELADWKRDAPQAEIVAAGKAHHAADALAQAARRAGGGEDVVVLIDSLTRFAESFGGRDEARELFDTGFDAANGTLTMVAALERPG